jgi:hypothetical protein
VAAKNCSVGIPVWGVNDALSIYPNPSANGISTIRGLSANAVISVYNASGQLLFKKHSGEESALIDLKDQPRGTYFVRIIDGENTTGVFKVMNQLQ